MTPLQKTYLEKLHSTAAANLEYFKAYLPNLYSLVIRDPMNVSVDVAESGDFVVRFDDGRSLRPDEVRTHVSHELDMFRDPNRKRQIVAFQDYLWDQNPGYGKMNPYHYSTLGVDYAFMMGRHYKLHYPGQEGVGKYPDFGSRKVPILLMFGAGLGYQFEPILEEFDVSQIFIIEHDINVFRMSLFFVDYVRLSHHATSRNAEITFVVELDADKIVQTVGRTVSSKWPHFFIHGASVFHGLPVDDATDTIKNLLVEGIWKWYFGWGYFDDEVTSLKHTIGNFANQVPICTKLDKVPEDAVAFIIGSGPSLDQLMPLIRKYKNKAVIFSCGTALSPLSHTGIVPDFQVEKERPTIVYDLLTGTQNPEYLKQIRFLGVNLVDPRLAPLFDEACLVMKMSDVGADLFLDSLKEQFNGHFRFEIQPTVTNTAMVVALNMGFKQIYLMGVDMGFKDETKHHSKHSAYLKSMPMAQNLRNVMTGVRKERRWPVEGNFCETVLTNEILDSARDKIESAVGAFPNSQVYNPNDGAKIKGTIPIHREEIKVDTDKATKAAAIKAITANFTRPAKYDIDALVASLVKSIQAVRAHYAEIAGRSMTTKMDAITAIAEMGRYLVQSHPESRLAQILVRGTLVQLLLLSYQFVSIIRDESEAVAKAQFDFGLIDEFLGEAATVITSLVMESSDPVSEAAQDQA
jgi:hypothetical protein